MKRPWKVTTVQEFVDKGEVELKTGPFGTQLHASDYVETGTPVINVRNIGFGSVVPEKLEFLDRKTVSRLSGHLLQKDDIVFGRKGAVERHAHIREAQNGWFQGSDCLRLRIRSAELNSSFISYTLLTGNHKQWMMNQCSHGATMASLNQAIICRIPLWLPDISTQNRIADILSVYDDLIENNTRRIKILEQMTQMLYREWFVNFRFPGHEKVKMVESELGLIPSDWRVERLDVVAKITMGQSPPSEHYNKEGKGIGFHQGVTNFGPRFPVNRSYCTSEGRIAESGDILMSVRAPVGRLNITLEKIVIGRGLCAIRSKLDAQQLLFQQLKEQFCDEDSMGSGTIFKAVTKEDVCGLKVLRPAAIIAARFTEIASPMFNELEVLTGKNTNLCATRDLLLPKLVSGEVSVEQIEEVALAQTI